MLPPLQKRTNKVNTSMLSLPAPLSKETLRHYHHYHREIENNITMRMESILIRVDIEYPSVEEGIFISKSRKKFFNAKVNEVNISRTPSRKANSQHKTPLAHIFVRE